MAWTVLEHPEFAEERRFLPDEVSDKLDELSAILEEFGPNLGRPLVDTLAGSKHSNMKEIRFALGGPWRFAIAFDPERNAVILVGGNKQGASEALFYRKLIGTADRRFNEWLRANRRG
jgi:hypothetical protein